MARMQLKTTLSDALAEALDAYSNLDQDWVIFVNDHKESIRQDSMLIEVTDADRDRYANKFDHFLRERGNMDPRISWIAYMINNVETYEDFTRENYVLVPNFSSITNLYRKYRTSKNRS